MFDHYQNTTYSNQRQHNAMQEAEQARLAAEAAAADPKPFYAPVLNSIGHTLIEMGKNLEARYGEAPTITTGKPLAHANK